jgi:hypothetical protein
LREPIHGLSLNPIRLLRRLSATVCVVQGCEVNATDSRRGSASRLTL